MHGLRVGLEQLLLLLDGLQILIFVSCLGLLSGGVDLRQLLLVSKLHLQDLLAGQLRGDHLDWATCLYPVAYQRAIELLTLHEIGLGHLHHFSLVLYLPLGCLKRVVRHSVLITGYIV